MKALARVAPESPEPVGWLAWWLGELRDLLPGARAGRARRRADLQLRLERPFVRVLGRRGSQGAISGLANFMPRVVRQLVLDPDGIGTDAAEARVATLLQRVGGYALLPALKGLMDVEQLMMQALSGTVSPRTMAWPCQCVAAFSKSSTAFATAA